MFPYDIANMDADIAQLQQWVQLWMGWMMAVNIVALIFIKHQEARWILAAMAGAFMSVAVLYGFFGYSRILGLGHVLIWTPLAVYLLNRIRSKSIELKSIYGVWICIILVTIVTSLAFDYLDTIRYVLGERGVMVGG